MNVVITNQASFAICMMAAESAYRAIAIFQLPVTAFRIVCYDMTQHGGLNKLKESRTGVSGRRIRYSVRRRRNRQRNTAVAIKSMTAASYDSPGQ